MKAPGILNSKLTPNFRIRSTKFSPNPERVFHFRPSNFRFPVTGPTTASRYNTTPAVRSGSTATAAAISSNDESNVFGDSPQKLVTLEENIEKVIYRCRFLAILAVWGSLVGSILCFVKGSGFVVASFQEFFVNRGKVIFSLVEAIDVYLLGTVMLVFGMGLYELFISNLDIAKTNPEANTTTTRCGSNLFGLFTLKERPKWLEIKTVGELKTKLGHVIVMLLLIGLFDKSKKAVINSAVDLLYFAASVLLSSVSLYLLSKLNGSK